MKIVHYSRSVRATLGGVSRAAVDLCTALARNGHEVHLVTLDAAETEGLAAGDTPVRVTALPDGLRLRRSSATRVRALLEGAAAVHLHDIWDPVTAALGRQASAAGVPYVVSVHGMLDAWSMAQKALKKRVYLRTIGRRLFREAAAVHCTARAELAQAARWIAPGRGVVIPLVCDITPYTQLPGPELALASRPELRAARPRLLFLSRIHPKKGIERLLEAMAELAARGIEAHAIIAGGGEEAYIRSLRERARSLDLEARVHFIGFVAGREKVSLYQAADVFVLPTSQENFGFVLFEALLAAAPVVTTRGADTWPELEASGGAVITDDDATSQADVIESLLANPQRRSEMGAAGRAWALRALQTERVIGQYERLYATGAME